MADFEFSAELDDSQIESAFKNMETKGARAFKGLEKDLAKVGVRLDEVNNRFRRIDNSGFVSASKVVRALNGDLSALATEAKQAGNAINNNSGKGAKGMGVLAGATAAVTNKLLEMGATAVNAFADIIKGSIDAAKALEVTEKSLLGIFEGNEAAATATIKRIREESVKLGLDLEELAPSFLPKVEDFDQFVEVSKLAASLATLDPEQGASGARIALNEALAGDVVSLRKRFELDVGGIKELQSELGNVDGLIQGLGVVLKARGQDFDNLATTASFAFNQANAIAGDLQKTLGEPILDALKEDLIALNSFFLENKDSIDLIAGSIGDLIGDIADLSGDQLLNFTEGLDFEAIQDLILDLQNIVAIAETFKEFSDERPLAGIFDGVGESAGDLEVVKNATIGLIGVLAILDTTVQASLTSLRGYADIASRIASGDLSISNVGEELLELGRTVESETITILDSANQKIGALNNTIEENEKRLRDRTDALKEDTSAGEAEADQFLANARAAEAETAAAEELAEAQNKLNEARDKFDTDKSRASADLELKQQRKLIDAQIESSKKREDIARKNAQAIQDIRTKQNGRIEDAAKSLTRKEEDLVRKNSRQAIEIEQESANRKIEIEVDFRRELERIRAKFDFDAQEAIRQNDAIAFLRVQRQKDFEIQQAGQKRDEETQDTESSAIEQRQKLAEQLVLQQEDARIANARRLEDLQITLERELQAQAIKNTRELEQVAINEQRKREEIAKTFERQQQDFDRAWERRLQDLEAKYAREIEITRRNEQLLSQIKNRSRNRRRDGGDSGKTSSRRDEILANGRDLVGGGDKGKGGTPSRNEPLVNLTGRKFGGYTPGGIDFLVGENGAEIVRLPRSGNIVPNNQLQFNPATSGTTNINNRTENNLNLDAVMNSLSPQQLAIIQQLMNQLNLSLFQ